MVGVGQDLWGQGPLFCARNGTEQAHSLVALLTSEETTLLLTFCVPCEKTEPTFH